jgi:hypothetical protein
MAKLNTMSRSMMIIVFSLLVLLILRNFVSPLVITHPLGKLVLLLFVIYLSMNFGVQAGVLSALFVIFLFQDVLEGMENNVSTSNGKDADADAAGDAAGDADADAAGDTKETSAIKTPKVEVDIERIKIEDKTKPKQTVDLIDKNPGDLRNKDNFNMENPDAAGAGSMAPSVPVGVGTNNSKPVNKVKEGFASFS